MTRCGYLRRALTTGSPVVMPKALAGMDLARTTPCLVEVSPPTMEGIVRRSTGSPCSRRASAVQLKKAELTSI